MRSATALRRADYPQTKSVQERIERVVARLQQERWNIMDHNRAWIAIEAEFVDHEIPGDIINRVIDAFTAQM